MKIFISWFLFLSFVGAIVVLLWHRQELSNYLPSLPERGTMSGLQAIAFGFALAFMWAEVLRLGSRKPFNCLKCMCAWFTMFIALLFHVQFWYMYLAIGVTIGAVFEAIKMRWL